MLKACLKTLTTSKEKPKPKNPLAVRPEKKIKDIFPSLEKCRESSRTWGIIGTCQDLDEFLKKTLKKS
jgi:hypothetical protein